MPKAEAGEQTERLLEIQVLSTVLAMRRDSTCLHKVFFGIRNSRMRLRQELSEEERSGN